MTKPPPNSGRDNDAPGSDSTKPSTHPAAATAPAEAAIFQKTEASASGDTRVRQYPKVPAPVNPSSSYNQHPVNQEEVVMRIEPSGRGIDHALSAVNPEVRQALNLSHETLSNMGIPHVLIGGLAVGAHGYAYATRDVDYLVPEDAAFQGGLIITFKSGVPIRVGDVAIDYLVPGGPENVMSQMQECLAKSLTSPKEVVYAPSDLLTYMKLKAGRAKDTGAVVELLKTGMDADDTRAFLVAAGDSTILDRFDKCVRMAKLEEES